MNDKKISRFAAKHGEGAGLDERVAKALQRETEKGELPCAVAFKVVEKLAVQPEAVGKATDLLELRLVKCQLGLFGYHPKKSIVTPLASVPPDLEAAIRDRLEAGTLPCRSAWSLAEVLGIHKMQVSAACDALGIRIKPCQLGAF